MVKKETTIHVPVLARVEGEGALVLYIRDNLITQLELKIYEPPRLFEKLLEGREYHEVPDIVARICGICPVAYQMSAVQALEQIFSTHPNSWIQDMRRVFYCGEWIQSHALHIHLLALPDFLGFNTIADMAQKYAPEVRRGFRLQAIGNDIITLFGGRSVHPVGARVGGFHYSPSYEEVTNLLDRLRKTLLDAESLVEWISSIDIPRDSQSFCSVALHHPNEYPMLEGRLYSSNGLDIDICDFAQHFEEFQVPYSTALHSLLNNTPYLVGPLARMNINYEQLPDASIDLLKSTGIQFPSQNMFHSIIARALEIHYAIYETIRLLENYRQPDDPFVPVQTCAGTGYACTEAPRGILWHQYKTDSAGYIEYARIVPPTSQNQARIEEDLHNSLQSIGLQSPEETLRKRAEQVIRNYDPCISCATHFLTLKVDKN